VSSFQSSTLGGSVSYGLPFSEVDNVSVGVGVEQSELTINSNSPSEYQSFVTLNGSRSSIVPVTAGWLRDTRDSAILPSTGMVNRLNLVLATPMGDLKYYLATYSAKWYVPLSKFTTLYAGGVIGYGEDYGESRLPFYKNYYAGGGSTIRGFKSSSLGPRNSENQSIGGKRKLVSNVEILTPIPGIKDDKSMRFSAFLDMGSVHNSYSDTLSDFRYSIGVGLNYYSPIGPIRLSLAEPLNEKQGDSVERFQFLLGAMF